MPYLACGGDILSILKETKLLQLYTIYSPKLDSELLTLTFNKLEQPLKALFPILVIPSPTITLVIVVQFWKALFPILVTPLFNTNTPSWVVLSQVDAFWSTLLVSQVLKLFKSAVAV